MSDLVKAAKTIARYIGAPTGNNWFGLRDDDLVEVKIKVPVRDIKALHAAISTAEGQRFDPTA